MDNVRLFLLLALGFVGMLLWQAWQQDYAMQPAAAQQATSTAGGQSTPADAPSVPAVTSIDSRAPTDTVTPLDPLRREIRVVTDTLDLTLDSRGGTIIRALLQNYPTSLDQPDIKFELLGTQPTDYFIAQSGLLAIGDQTVPTHQADFGSTADYYEMSADADALVVDLSWQSPTGVQVVKRYRFTRGTHAITLEHIVTNGSEAALPVREYRQLQRGEPTDTGNALMYTYTGGAIYSPQDKYQKYGFGELADEQPNRDVANGWVAMIEHYFLAAFVPPQGELQRFYGRSPQPGRYIIGNYTPQVAVAPGASHAFTGQLWLGPKLQEELANLAPGLDLTVDYGWLAFLAQPMFWILEWIHDFVGNWGWTIIIFTILIKLVFFYPSAVSYRSMAGMRKLAPRLQALKDRYGDDKQRMQQAMMQIYKEEKINPLAGCLPMLLQMPFFIALYWVLLESVELRQASWIFWIDDLSIKDPYFVLPLLMGATMFIQMKLNPAPPDPMQAKIMMALPVVFTAMFAFFPSGLVLYWFVNNLLSIAQQWVITRQIEQGGKPA